MADSNNVGATNAGKGDPRSSLRRRDRGKDDEWVVAFLKRASYGFLATVGHGGQPFLNSNLFVYDDAGDGRRIIDVEAWSGKQKEVPADFPGAFSLDALPVPFPARGATSG